MVSFHSFLSLPENKIEPKPDYLSPNERKWPPLEEKEVDVALQLRPPASTMNAHRPDKVQQESIFSREVLRKISKEPGKKINISNPPMSLDLQLNLPGQSNSNSQWIDVNSLMLAASKTEGGIKEENQMVAVVCRRCTMLVMLCKSSPSCPNCKFMHSPPQNSFRQYF